MQWMQAFQQTEERDRTLGKEAFDKLVRDSLVTLGEDVMSQRIGQNLRARFKEHAGFRSELNESIMARLKLLMDQVPPRPGMMAGTAAIDAYERSLDNLAKFLVPSQ